MKRTTKYGNKFKTLNYFDPTEKTTGITFVYALVGRKFGVSNNACVHNAMTTAYGTFTVSKSRFNSIRHYNPD